MARSIRSCQYAYAPAGFFGWYFTERYIFQNFSDFTPDPTECAVYIVRQNEKALFDEADYLITDFGNFAAVYPRYWAE